MAPVIAAQMVAEQWGPAVALLAVAGATDWADGAAARHLGHTSKLGSYLDPFADKVLAVAVVGTLGAMQLLPAWLAALVVARDGGQVAVTLAYRMAMFGWRWPGAAAFFEVDGAPGGPAGGGAARPAGAPSGDMPQIRPLLVSKLNTVLTFVLVGGCVAHQWQGVPSEEVLAGLDLVVGSTTAASGLTYLWLYCRGRLLK